MGELRDRMLADALSDVQHRKIRKIGNHIVGEPTPSPVRDACQYFGDCAFRFAGRLASGSGLISGSLIAYENAGSFGDITRSDLTVGAVVGVMTGLFTNIPTQIIFNGPRAIRRRAKRELKRELAAERSTL